LFVIWGGGEDASLFLPSDEGHHRRSKDGPSKVVALSVEEVDTFSGESNRRGPDILSGGFCSTDKESRDESSEESGELHGGY
jgi:hypothetical protein